MESCPSLKKKNKNGIIGVLAEYKERPDLRKNVFYRNNAPFHNLVVAIIKNHKFELCDYQSSLSNSVPANFFRFLGPNVYSKRKFLSNAKIIIFKNA